MSRVKRGFVARKRRSKILKLTKGFKGSSSNLFRVANQQKMKALKFSYSGRRLKKRTLRRLWICRINAAVRYYNLNYNQTIFKLKNLNMLINRKWLSQLAVRDSEMFLTFVNTASVIFNQS